MKNNTTPKYKIDDKVYLENPNAVYSSEYIIINTWQDPSGIHFYRLNDGYFYPEIYIRKTPIANLLKNTDKNILKDIDYKMHMPCLQYKEHYRKEDNVLTCNNARALFEIIINMDTFYYNNTKGVPCRTKPNTWYVLVKTDKQNTKSFKSFYEAYVYANKTYIDYVKEQYEKHQHYNEIFNALLNNKHSERKEIPNMFNYLDMDNVK